MSIPAPITVPEMAGMLQRAMNICAPGVAEAPQGDAFELTTPYTGQRFRVTVTEVPGWSDQMDRELAETLTEESAR